MSSINLFLLGFLKERSWSPYELALFIKNNKFEHMIKISTPAVYKNLVKLADKGYLVSRSVKDSQMPERKIYSITHKGEEYHLQLLNKIFENDFKYYFDFNAGILNLSMINKNEGIKILKSLYKKLIDKKEFYNNYKNEYNYIPFFGLTIVDQIINLNDAMINWIEEFINKSDNLEWGKGLKIPK